MFRPINDLERNALLNSMGKGKAGMVAPCGMKVAYFRDGNLTTAVVLARGGTLVLAGSAKRNPLDRNNPLTGQMTAFTRAIQSEPQEAPEGAKTIEKSPLGGLMALLTTDFLTPSPVRAEFEQKSAPFSLPQGI